VATYNWLAPFHFDVFSLASICQTGRETLQCGGLRVHISTQRFLTCGHMNHDDSRVFVPRPLVVCAELALVVRLLQTFYVNLIHLKHRLHDPFCFLRIFIMQQFS